VREIVACPLSSLLQFPTSPGAFSPTICLPDWFRQEQDRPLSLHRLRTAEASGRLLYRTLRSPGPRLFLASGVTPTFLPCLLPSISMLPSEDDRPDYISVRSPGLLSILFPFCLLPRPLCSVEPFRFAHPRSSMLSSSCVFLPRFLPVLSLTRHFFFALKFLYLLDCLLFSPSCLLTPCYSRPTTFESQYM